MQKPYARYLLGGAVLVLLAACDREHPALAPTISALDAWKYGDVAAFGATHVLTTEHSPYCEKPEFDRVLAQAKQTTDADQCARIAEVQSDAVDALGDEARLLVQIKRAVCETPEIDCRGYSAMILGSQFEAQPRPTEYKVQKVLGDKDTAVVYLDLNRESKVEHRVVRLRRFDQTWYVLQGLLSE